MSDSGSAVDGNRSLRCDAELSVGRDGFLVVDIASVSDGDASLKRDTGPSVKLGWSFVVANDSVIGEVGYNVDVEAAIVVDRTAAIITEVWGPVVSFTKGVSYPAIN